LTNQSINRRFNQSSDEWINQSINRRFHQAIDEWINQSINRQFHQSIDEFQRKIEFSSFFFSSSIKFWDLRKLTASKPEAVHTLQLDGPTEFGPAFTSLCLDGSKTQLFASCMDKTIYKFDAGPKKGAEPVAKYMGADICSFYIKCSLSPDEELLGCGSSEKNAFLFKVIFPEISCFLSTEFVLERLDSSVSLVGWRAGSSSCLAIRTHIRRGHVSCILPP
jgi:hypothetical protein